jgi:hypothetical protein
LHHVGGTALKAILAQVSLEPSGSAASLLCHFCASSWEGKDFSGACD